MTRLPRGATHGERGAALLEWTLGSALGIVTMAAAVSLLSHQGQILKAMISRDAQDQDRLVLVQVIRSELRVAGQRGRLGPSPAHDQLLVDNGRTPTIQYLCDRCGAPESGRSSSLRIEDGVLGHRSLGATAHQALNDPRVLAIRGWQVVQGQTADCSPWIAVQLVSDPPPSSVSTPDPAAGTVTVRPRNLGLLPCEADTTRTSGSASTP